MLSSFVNSSKKLPRFENSFITIRDSAFSYLEHERCKQHPYKLEGTSTTHSDPYTCDDNPNNRARGYCILSFPDALKHCNQDPNCGGYGITTNQGWHQSFDRDESPAVELFPIGSQPIYNFEWIAFIKDDSN